MKGKLRIPSDVPPRAERDPAHRGRILEVGRFSSIDGAAREPSLHAATAWGGVRSVVVAHQRVPARALGRVTRMAWRR
ncbi:MAG: hypothetical protein JSR65_11695 [Proteobacteria bacterium]|nr:hypothetical protein [Pseudomonadota bacterium]